MLNSGSILKNILLFSNGDRQSNFVDNSFSACWLETDNYTVFPTLIKRVNTAKTVEVEGIILEI
ncbi:MAG: hypothetical protein ACFBSE_04695 [Prochloraceae cyanobacterium]